MGILTGYLCFVCLVLLLLKALTRRFHLAKADQVLWRLHKPICAALITACLLHFALTLPVFSTRSPLVSVTGVLTVLSLILLIAFCHAQGKEPVKQVRRHRVLAAFLSLCAAGHIAAYFADFQAYQSRISEIQLQAVDTSGLADGQYVGEYDAGYIYAKVQVELIDGKIQALSPGTSK